MNISKAMKKLKKLKNRSSTIGAKISKHNRTLTEKDHIYEVEDLIKEYKTVTDEIVSTKLAIMKANVDSGNYELILRIGELKGFRSVLDNVDTSSGIDEEAMRYGSSEKIEYKAQISEKKMEEIVTVLEEEIEGHIDTLDEFNAKTTIQVVVAVWVVVLTLGEFLIDLDLKKLRE